MNYITYIHSDPEITTIDDFLSPGSITTMDKRSFLNYKGEDQLLKNIDRIYDQYDYEEKIEYKNAYDTGNLNLLKVNTLLSFPKDSTLNLEVLSVIGKNQLAFQSNFNAFFSEKLKGLLTDKNYTYETQNTKDIRSFASIWVWSRVFNKLIDITSFINNLTTNVTKTGGNFSFEIMGIREINDIQSNTYYKKDEYYYKNIPYFHKYLCSNDLIFIRFEKLKNEKKRSDKSYNFVLSNDQIVDNVYDMIGLIDKNTNLSFPGEEVVKIEGRDLIKVLIEDGSYFIPIQFSTNIIANLQDNNKLIQRIENKYELFALRTFQQIRQSIQFIINHLSNIGIVPNDLFEKYGDRRTKVYRRKDGTNESVQITDDKLSENSSLKSKSDRNKRVSKINIEETYAEGIWQIIKLLIDENVSDRRIVDSSISQADGSLLNQFNKICQEPFVEFMTDTYGDEFYFIVRQPPFTQKAIQNVIDEGLIIDIEDKDVLTTDLFFDEEGIYSWYQLEPIGSFVGTADKVTLAYIPAVYFPQYSNIWGNKRLKVISNYIPYSGFIGNKYEEDRRYVLEQAVNDYAFILETNVHNPFLRKGTIVLTRDRRIKRGTYVRLISTKEIFYVDGVNNSLSVNEGGIDRSTNLQVKRGMVEKYVKGITIDNINYSYFNIVDIKYISDAIKEKINKGKELKVRDDFGVNEKVFNFFLNRNQFE